MAPCSKTCRLHKMLSQSCVVADIICSIISLIMCSTCHCSWGYSRSMLFRSVAFWSVLLYPVLCHAMSCHAVLS